MPLQKMVNSSIAGGAYFLAAGGSSTYQGHT